MKSRYSFLRRFNFEALYNAFLGLQPREQIFVLVGGVVFLLFLIGFPISLASSQLSSLEKAIEDGRQKQREVLRRLENFQQLKEQLKGLEGQVSKGFDATITTTLATLAEGSGLKDRIDSIREKGATPSELFDEVSVEVKLTKVTLSQLVDYLYKIEHHPELFIRITQMSIKRRYDNKKLLDVSFWASTFRLQT